MQNNRRSFFWKIWITLNWPPQRHRTRRRSCCSDKRSESLPHELSHLTIQQRCCSEKEWMRRWRLDGLIHYAGRFLSCVMPSFHHLQPPSTSPPHTHRCVKKPFAALCLCKRCGLNCKNFLVLFPCTAVVRGKSESGTGGESTATKIKDFNSLSHWDKNKEKRAKRRGKKRTGGNGREWVAGRKPHPVRLKLSRPPGHGVVAQAGGKIKQRVTGLGMAKTNTRNRQPPRHLHAMTISMIKTDE